MAIEPIKGFYVHDEVTDTDGVAKYDYDELVNAPIGFDMSADYSIEHSIYNNSGVKSANVSTNDATKPIEIEYLDYIKFSASIGTGYPCVLVFDANMTLLETACVGGTFVDVKYTITDETAKYIVVQSRNQSHESPFTMSLEIYRQIIPKVQKQVELNTDEIFETVNTATIEHYTFNVNGVPVYNTQYDSTVLIPITQNAEITFSGVTGDGTPIVFLYDSNAQLIETKYLGGTYINVTFTVDNNNARFVRFQSRNSTWGTISTSLAFSIKNSNIKKLLSTDASKPIKVRKLSNTIFDVDVSNVDGTGTVKYRFYKYSKTWDSLEYLDANGNTQQATDVVSADYWNNSEIHTGDGSRYLAQGNSNFIVKVTDAPCHVGDGHGNEVAKEKYFFADGQMIDIENMGNGSTVFCTLFKMIEKTNVFQSGGGQNTVETCYPVLDANGLPVVQFEHYIEMTFSVGNEITIDNKLLVKQNGITFEQCHGAMLECNFGDFDVVLCNNDETTTNSINSTGQTTTIGNSTINLNTNQRQVCNTVEMFRDGFYIRQEMHNEDAERQNSVRFFYYDNRLKCYFQPCKSSFGVIDGSLDTFNNGDVLSVVDKRFISIS